jgi:hypothetical protein
MSSNPAISIGVTATDTASHVLQGVDKQIANTGHTVETTSSKIISKTDKMAASFKTNFTNIATSVAGLGAGIASFAASFGTLERAQNTADQANITYQKSLERLSKLQEGGKATTEQLALAQEQVRVNAEKLKTAQGDVTDTYMTFLANVPSQLISFGVAGSSIMKLLGLSHGVAGAGAQGQAVQTNVLSGALRFANVAAVQTSVGMRILQIAMGPVGWAILGVSTLVVLLSTNAFGLRDAFFNLGKQITAFLDVHFKPLADAMRWFYDNVLKPIGSFLGGEMPTDVKTTETSIASLDATVGAASQTTQAMLFDVNSSVTMLADNAVSQLNKIQSAYERFKAGYEDVRSIYDDDFIGLSSRRSSGGGKQMSNREITDHFNKITRGVPVRKAASGFDGFVTRPSLFLAGEAGPEHVKITPGGSNTPNVNITINTRDPDTSVNVNGRTFRARNHRVVNTPRYG